MAHFNALKYLTIPKDIRQRVYSALVLIPMVFALVWVGGISYVFVVVVATTMMMYEWSDIIAIKRTDMNPKHFVIWRWVGVVYISLFATALIYLRQLEDVDGTNYGFGVVMVMLLFVWATDIAAYFSGKTIGGPKILPKISPNKTWAGLLGGIGASACVGMFISFLGAESWSAMELITVGALLAILSQMGDFFESYVKRHFGVKDSGTLIPGHGGLLDRLDGTIPVAIIFMIWAWVNDGLLF